VIKVTHISIDFQNTQRLREYLFNKRKLRNTIFRVPSYVCLKLQIAKTEISESLKVLKVMRGNEGTIHMSDTFHFPSFFTSKILLKQLQKLNYTNMPLKLRRERIFAVRILPK